ncbi:MAG: DinB family protein [Thermoplasmata archaeon]
MATRPSAPVLEVRALLDYDRTLFEAYVRRIRRLPDAVTHRDLGIGHGSMIATLTHILHVQESWLVYIVPRRQREIDTLWQDPTRTPKDWKAFDAYAARVWDGIEARLPTLTAEELDRRVKAFWMPGSYTVRDAILQISFEEAHHIGELIGAMWRLNIEPPAMTWIELRPGSRSSKRRRT